MIYFMIIMIHNHFSIFGYLIKLSIVLVQQLKIKPFGDSAVCFARTTVLPAKIDSDEMFCFQLLR